MARIPPSSRGGVQIEVLDEDEFAAEEQAQAEREQEERQRKRAAAAAAAAAATAAEGAATAASSAGAQAVAADAHASSDAPESRWSALLSPLLLPPFLATLHETRVYDPVGYERLRNMEVSAFQRSAARGWKELLAELDAQLDRTKEADRRPPTHELRPVLTPLLSTCLRFLLPALPPAPTPLSAPSEFSRGEDGAVDTADLGPDSLVQRAQPFEMVWQNETLTSLALQGLQKLAQLFRRESESVDFAASSELVTATGADPPPASAGVEAVMAAPSMQRFFAWVLPTHLLPFLRQEMRSVTGPGVAPAALGSSTRAGGDAAAATAAAALDSSLSQSTQEWKQARHFPAAFFVCFLCAHLSPSLLAAQLRSLLVLLLPLLDDHEVHLKVAGLMALQRVVRVVPALHFGDGWGGLLLRSLQTSLSFKDPAIQALVVPTLVQTNMALYPALMISDWGLMQQLHLTAGPEMGAARSSSTAVTTVGDDVLSRFHAHAALLDTLLHELSYLSLSPSLENLFPTFVYAQTLLPALLYLGPLVVCDRLQTLLPIVLQWCSTLVAPVQRRLVKLGWEALECMLSLSVLADRLAEQHLARLLEAAAQVWINDEEPLLQAAPSSRRKSAKQADSSPATVPRTATVPLSDPLFHARYTCQPTVAHCVRLLRDLAPEQFGPLWLELRQMPELKGLDAALQTSEEDCAQQL